MTIRVLPLLFVAALGLPVQGQPAPFGLTPPVVRPGPPRLPTDPDRWLPWRVFTWRDGVKPGNPALAQDTQGYIWVDGPTRYNGRTWQRVEIPGMSAPEQIWSLLAGSDGSLWFGPRNGGLLRLQDGVWTRYGPENGIPTGLVNTMAEESRGTIWVGTVTGLARCHEGRCAEERVLRGTHVRSLVVTRDEGNRPALWIGTGDGLFRLEGIDGPSPVLSPRFADGTVLPSPSIRSLAETVSPTGRSLWVGTDAGLARLERGVWTRYDERSGFPHGPIVTLLASHSAAGRPVVWGGSFRAGLVRFEDDGRWTLYDTRSGLPANYVYRLLATEERAGEEPTLWVATPAGVARLERERWNAVDARSGMPNDIVVGLGEATFPDGLHTTWIGTVGGVMRLTPGGWKRFAVPPAETEVVFNAADTREKDGSTALWMGTLDGLHRFSHGRWTSFTTRNSPLPHDWILSLLAVPTGGAEELWIGTSQGLARYANGAWTVFRSSSGLPGGEVRALATTRAADGSIVLWAGTDHGVGRFAAGRWEQAEVPCLPHPMGFDLNPATGPDGAGWLWIGTQGGIARQRLGADGRLQGSCQSLSRESRPSLLHPSVLQVETDRFGRIYLFTDWGVTRLTLGPGQDLATARVETFDGDDGLPGMEFNRASFVDHLGRIWAGATGGAAVLDPAPPERAGAARLAAPLRLERVLVGGRERPLPDGAVLRYDEGNLEFQYALLSFRREQTTRYQTQLLGLDDHPSPWTPEARTVYNRLPQGDYTFRVWGRAGDGTVSGPIEVSFRIQPAPWSTPWAITLYAAVLVGLGFGVNLLRVKALARRAAQLEAQVAERTRELAEANRQLELASLTDPLTGLSNRRVLALNIEPDVRQAVRNALGTAGPRERNGDLIFYFLDIDHFKQLNDRAGHAAGDRVLVEIAARLREAARNTDSVVRWGGEEFLIVSRWADRRAGEVLAERLLQAMAGTPFPAGPGAGLTVTCSVGWAPYPWRPEIPDAVHHEAVMSLADRALYLAKREGRNRAVGVLPGPDGPAFPEGPLAELDGGAVRLVRSMGPREDAPEAAAVVAANKLDA